jgi:DNA polymerase-1
MLIDTVEKFNSVIPDLMLCSNPTVDTETNGLNPWGTKTKEANSIIGIAIGTEREAYYFPFRHLQGTNLPIELMEFFRFYLSNPDRVYGGFNYKFDMHMLRADGVPYAANIEDAMLSAHLLNENEPSFKLKDLGDKYLDEKSSLEESILKAKLKEIGGTKGDMGILSPEDVEPYACDDVRITRGLLKIHREALEYFGLYDIWKQVCYYSVIMTHMENRGLLLNIDLIQQYQEDAKYHIEELQEILNERIGRKINVNSYKQVCALLEVESSSAEVLEVLSEAGGERGELARMISDLRGWLSVDSRYYTPYLQDIDDNNVLRTSFLLHGTISGRLSSRNPNLQAVARKTDTFKVKDIFIAREGYTLVSMDYSQAEMRLACFYAKEETMAELIRNGEDLHSTTAERLGIPRDAAKRINFGVIYGIGAGALSEQLRIDRNTAYKYLQQYHQLYPQFRVLMNACKKTANDQGYIRMWTGRMRHYDENNPTHKSMSNLIQGGVAEMMRVAITRAYPLMHELRSYMILQVHDQVIYEIPDSMVAMAVPILKANMENFEFDPKMTVDVSIGKSWGEMESWNDYCSRF